MESCSRRTRLIFEARSLISGTSWEASARIHPARGGPCLVVRALPSAGNAWSMQMSLARTS